MSEHQPASGTPEYLEHGARAPIPPEPTAPRARGRRGRRAWWVGGGVVALLGAGAGAWAVMNFFQQGAQPAEALPSGTVGYLSIDLDPSGGQKIDAFRTLNKFPAFKDQVGVDSVDQLRHKIGDEIVAQAHCPNLDYDRDIDPWLGDRAAVAVVDLPGPTEPDSVVVVQVTDEQRARDGIAKLNSCASQGTGHPAGYVVQHGWAILADTQAYADKVAAATDQGTLADDATYQKWTKAVGDPGVVNAYAAPAAGRLVAQKLGSLPGIFSSGGMSSSASQGSTGGDAGQLVDALGSFDGAAATLRFTSHGMELAVAGDGSSPELADFTGTTGGALVQRLPADTAAAAGISLRPGWFERRVDTLSGVFGAGESREQLYRELSSETGLDVPQDIDTLFGSGVAVSVSKSLDVEAAMNSSDGAGVPVAVTVKGDPAGIDGVLGKLRAKAGDLPFLGADSAGDLEVIGPSQEYRREVLAGGSLGDDDTFRSVVPHAGDASSVFYLDVDALEPALTKLTAGDQETLDNLTPLRAIGMSTWNDGGVTRFSFEVSTN